MSWLEIQKRSAIARKGWDFARQIPRGAVRIFARREEYRCHPPIIGNSFPKSGTHQLLQILSAFPDAVHWGSFIASMPSFPFRQRSKEAHIRRIRALVPGEYLGAHIFFDESYAAAMKEMNAVHFFIYRDLRDVAISDVYYVRDMNRWHQMHNYFANRLTTDDARLMTAICGVQEPDIQFDYPDIATRMRRYLRWIGRPDVFALKYEDLNSPKQEAVILEMIDFYSQHVDREVDRDAVLRRALSNIDPYKSHTFREGGSGKWKDHFSAEHLQRFNELAGELNVVLGYTP